MHKRLFAFILALAMTFGMFPAVIPVFAEETTPSNVIHAASGTVTLDGDLSETEWSLVGGLADGFSFGALYDADYLYLGIAAALDSLSVKLNGVEVTAEIQKGDAATEAKISLAAANLDLYNYDQSAALEITAAEASWTGTVHFDSAAMGNRAEGESFTSSVAGTTSCDISDGAFSFKLDSETYDTTITPVLRHTLSGALAGVPTTAGVSVVEFDMTVEEMPVYADDSCTKGKYWVVPGMTMVVNCDQDNKLYYTFGISNLESYGLAIAIQRLNDSGKADAPHIVSLGKQLNEQFHIRLEYMIAGNSLTVYCDDTQLCTVANLAKINPSKNNIFLSALVTSEADAKKGDVAFTVSELRAGSLKSGSPLDNLTVYSILGENTTPEAVGTNLSLPATVTDPLLGSVDVTWKSSDTSIVGDDGVVVLGAVGTVTMTAALAKDPSVTKAFELTVSSEKPDVSLDALLNAEGITIDGKVGETVWAKWTRFGTEEEKPSGTMAAAWDRECIYLAMNTAGANTLTLTIGEKTVEVDLTAKSVKLNGEALADAELAVVGSTAELKLPMDALDAKPEDYNDTVAFKAVLTGDNGSTELEENLLTFTGKLANIQTLANSTGGWSINSSGYAYAAAQTNAVHYIYNNKNNFSVDETTWISQDLKFVKMPVTSGNATGVLSAEGYYYYASRDWNGTDGETFKACLYADSEGKLYANLLVKRELNATVDLGVSVGEEFRLTTAWNPNGSVDLYVDGVLVGSSNGSCSFRYDGCGDNTLSLRYLSGAVANPGDVEFEVKNVTTVKGVYQTVADELTVSQVLNRVDLDRVAGNLPLVSTYSSAYFENIPLTWTTSDENIISNTGVVTRGDTAQTCTITLTAKGKELWTKTATVLAASEKEQASPAVYTTAFANDVVVDGSIVGENWHMANRILADGVLVGEMGAAWNLEYLYIAVRNSGKDIELTVKDKEIVLTEVQSAVSGDYTEIAIPMSDIDTTVTDYGVELPVSVTVGEGTYSGTLVLSSTDWWGAGNAEDPLPMLSGNVKSVSRGNGIPDGNQGAAQVTNGWHLYDRWSATGTNPDGIRTYILFMKTEPYENFANRDGTTTVEFDFQAINMPVYTIEDATTTMLPDAYACYGVNWHLSDAQDSMKNANVIYGGIFNTEDGLYLVTGGKETDIRPLNKSEGDKFRIKLEWNADDSLNVYIDGVLEITMENQSVRKNAIGNSSFVVNMLRNLEQPKSAEDDINIYLTDIAFGTAFPDDPIATVTWDDIKGENDSQNNVTSDLVLPQNLYNYQLEKDNVFTWSSSNTDVITNDGKVIRPETGGAVVTLTVSMVDGSSKSFKLIVVGQSTESGNTLVVQGDTNPAVGSGTVYETPLFTFDTNNNSIIEDMQESKTINLVCLTDLDAYSRINRESLTLWISGDNTAYTQIEDYKLVQIGKHWYLYDFEATGRYVKVHYTHFDGTDADFIAPLNGIICGSYDSGLAQPETATTVTAPATTLRDQTVALDGISDTAFLRIMLNGELLYHYVEDGKVYVRIPEPSASGTTLTVWNGSELELSNKEACYEITYGTRESHQILDGNRWLLTVPAGNYTYGTVEQETLLAFGFRTIRASYDGGLTWVDYGTVDETVYNNMSTPKISSDIGWIFDEETGAMFCIAHKTNGFSTLDESYGRTIVFASYDMGKTWKDAFELQPDTVEGITFNYVITYSGGIRVPSYDGENAGIDYVFPAHGQYTNSGAFCTRVVYTTDAGKTWQMSKSILIDEGSQSGETGLSEAWIMANEDGTLVLYSRAQVVGEVTFAQAYSYDNGLTWTACDTKEAWLAETPADNKVQFKVSSVYSSNTQPLMFHYKQSNGISAPVFVWGGNNTLGSMSYVRTPLNVAVSYDGLDTWRNIQNLFSETSMDIYSMSGKSMIVNQSVAQVRGDTLLVSFERTSRNDKVWITATDFENYLYKTKGAYDDFESGNPHYEGWSAIDGESANVSTKASQGTQSLCIPENGVIARSIPYLQNGTITLDVYVTENTDITYALQPAVGTDPDANTLALIKISGMKLNDSIALKEGWNTVEIKLELTQSKATVSANGSSEELALEMNVGDYVCYVTAFAATEAYMDEFYVVSDLDAEVYSREIDADAQIVEFSPTLEDYVGLNYYVEVGADVAKGDAYMLFKHGDKEVKVYEFTVNSNGYRKYTYKINAKEMADEISATFCYGGGDNKTETKTYSAQAYAETVQNATGSEYTTELKQLAKDMAQYGAYAQKYFEHNENDLANAKIEGASDITKVDASDVVAYKPTVNDSFLKDIGVTLSGSLLLHENTTLRFSFKGEIPDGLTVLVNGEEAALVQDTDRSYVDVTGIAAKDLDADVVLTIQYNDQTMTVSYNPLSYCYNVLNSESYSQELKDLVRSLYLYNQSADAYFPA